MMTDSTTPRDGREMRVAAIGGLVTATFLFAMVIGVGRIGSFEALRLIQAVLDSALFLGSTVVAAAVTVLALMLTLVGLSLTSEYTFSPRLYSRAMSITRMAVGCLILGVGVLLAVTFPVAEVEEAAVHYESLYYILSIALALLGGMVTAMGLLIGMTLAGLIRVGDPDEESDIIEEDPAADAALTA